MEITQTIQQARTFIKTQKAAGKTVGLVPTMGYLHEGHLSLIEKARQMCDVVAVSIFVNPIQFGPNEDLDKYPRDLPRDAALCEKAGCDLLFCPQPEEMYQNPLTYVAVEELTMVLCGKSRPTHFRGVTTVVSKLFHIIDPDRAFFGQKDAQQLFVIKKMVQDLNFDIEIIGCPIVREADGLAKSSRNVYLSPEQRKDAVLLFQSLKRARAMAANGETDLRKIRSEIHAVIATSPLAEIDYIETVDTQDLKSVDTLTGQTLVALAVRFGSTRLIDNTILEAPQNPRQEASTCFSK